MISVSETRVSLADAKARLSELADRASRGETIIITKRGKPVLQLSLPGKGPRQPIDKAALQRLTDSMPVQEEGAGDFMRELRNHSRY